MSDAQRFLRVSTAVCHSNDEDCDSTGPAAVYKMLTTVKLRCSVRWKYWRNRKQTGFVVVACCNWTASVSQSVRTELLSSVTERAYRVTEYYKNLSKLKARSRENLLIYRTNKCSKEAEKISSFVWFNRTFSFINLLICVFR